jgi:hypothetical protein
MKNTVFAFKTGVLDSRPKLRSSKLLGFHIGFATHLYMPNKEVEGREKRLYWMGHVVERGRVSTSALGA